MKTLALPKVSFLSLLLTLVISFGSCAANSTSEPQVKQSSSGICHDKSSGSFVRTKSYIPFDTIATCVEAGGRLPKGKVRQIEQLMKPLTKVECLSRYMVEAIGITG
jgi:hypothetical protein